MLRTIDSPYGTCSTASALRSGLMVKCPVCGGPGAVTADEETFSFCCELCHHVMRKPRAAFRRKVEGLCQGCGRYYRAHILEEDQNGSPVRRVACPYCGHAMDGRVQKVPSGWYTVWGTIQNGREPFFGLELWFLSSYRGRPVWALNRGHLTYLIGYLSAGIRERPLVGHLGRTQADQLPTYMKTAKNRSGILKCLERMQER